MSEQIAMTCSSIVSFVSGEFELPMTTMMMMMMMMMTMMMMMDGVKTQRTILVDFA